MTAHCLHMYTVESMSNYRSQSPLLFSSHIPSLPTVLSLSLSLSLSLFPPSLPQVHVHQDRPDYGSTEAPARPRNFLQSALIACLLCCPIGIKALLYSLSVSQHVQRIYSRIVRRIHCQCLCLFCIGENTTLNGSFTCCTGILLTRPFRTC